MGLTIHYTIEFSGTRKELISKLDTIRNKCLDYPFAEVNDILSKKITKQHIDIFNWLQDQCYYPNNDFNNIKMRDLILEMIGTNTWEMITLGETIFDEKDGKIVSMRTVKRPTTLVSMNIYPGKGCENCNVQFEKRGKKWICEGFCKTQYAENFVQSHLLVISLLDMFVENKFKVDVRDEGEYWETRDLKVLAENINDYTNLITGLGDMLINHFKNDKNFSIEMPIKECKNYMNVK